jgi:hypothetical protein
LSGDAQHVDRTDKRLSGLQFIRQPENRMTNNLKKYSHMPEGEKNIVRRFLRDLRHRSLRRER